MKISKLIEELERLKKELGDVPVQARNQAGDFNFIESTEMVNVTKRGEIKWNVFLDC